MLDIFHKAPLNFPHSPAVFSAPTTSFTSPIELLVLFKGQKRDKNHMGDCPGAYRAYGLSGITEGHICTRYSHDDGT